MIYQPMTRILLLTSALCFGSCAPASSADNETQVAAQALPISDTSLFEGIWQNDRGSQVTFKAVGQDAGGVLSGIYQTNVGQPDKSQSFPLTGFVEGDQISFIVNFKGYGSMTAWVGQLSVDTRGPYFNTLWHLTRDVEDALEDDDLWGSITAGASTFRPIDPAD